MTLEIKNQFPGTGPAPKGPNVDEWGNATNPGGYPSAGAASNPPEGKYVLNHATSCWELDLNK